MSADLMKRDVRAWPADDGTTDWFIAVQDKGRYWTWHRITAETAASLAKGLARARREAQAEAEQNAYNEAVQWDPTNGGTQS